MLPWCLKKAWAFLPSPILLRYYPHSYPHHLHQLQPASENGEFQRRCQVDLTLRNLRLQLPALLRKPLEKNNTSVYAHDICLVGPNGEELASGYEELVTLSSTLVAASAAARQAGAFFARSLIMPNATFANVEKSAAVIDSKLALDANLDTVRVQWMVDLPLGQQLSGLSELNLDDSGRVNVHRLLDVSIDGQTLNAAVLSENLASLRKAFRSAFGDSVLLSNLRESPFAYSLFTDIRNGLIQQAKNGGVNHGSLPLPPLYVVDSVATAFFNESSNMTLIDNLPNTTFSPPLPGSLRWATFLRSRQSVSKFVNYGLPVLTGEAGFSSRDDFAKLFATNATLKGLDGTVMANGGERLAEFYRTMASLRKGTNGDWEIRQLSTDWDTMSVIVSWVATNPIKVAGKDRFRLSQEEGEEEPVIQTIEQLELKISGNRVHDPEWFRRFLTAVESGRSNAGVDMVVELLQQAGQPQKPQVYVSSGPPKLKQEAAASVYGIMCALHRDLPTLTDVNPRTPPAAEYLSSNVELRGYLDELLAKGSSSYSQVASVLTASLRGLFRTGRVTSAAPSTPKIEFTPEGSIKVSLEIKIKVKVGESDIGVPLNIETISEYKLNSQGKIKEHKLIETRVNGQLTPGDVVSRWIKGTTTNEPGPISIQSMLDALNWAQLLQWWSD